MKFFLLLMSLIMLSSCSNLLDNLYGNVIHSPPDGSSETPKEIKGRESLRNKLESFLSLYNSDPPLNSVVPEGLKGMYVNKISYSASPSGYLVYVEQYTELSRNIEVKEVPPKSVADRNDDLTAKVVFQPDVMNNRQQGNVTGDLKYGSSLIQNRPVGWDNEEMALQFLQKEHFTDNLDHSKRYDLFFEFKEQEWNLLQFKLSNNVDDFIPYPLKKVFGLFNQGELPLTNPKAIEINSQWKKIF